jgi:hypothetical protein
MSELKDFFKPEFAEGLTVGGKDLKIDSFTSGSIGKYIALYGLDDLFKNLPESLETIQISNRENNNIIFQVPVEIGKFTNLTQILFDNCIDSIPDTICNLKKLRFVALMNNKNLKTVPGCIVTLPKLVFLNLKGSDNVEVPEEIKQNGFSYGDGMWDLQKD